MIHKCEGECVHAKAFSNKSASVNLEGGKKIKKSSATEGAPDNAGKNSPSHSTTPHLPTT